MRSGLTPSRDVDRFLEMVEQGYEAVGDFSRWPPFLAGVNQQLEADRSAIYVRVRDQARLQMFETSPSDAYWAGQLADHYGAISPLTRVIRHKPAGWASVLQFTKAYWRGEFYNDYMVPQDLHHAAAGVMAKWGDTHRVTVIAFRGRRGRPFGEAAGQLQMRLMRQMRWAFRLRERLHGACPEGPGLWSAWEVCPHAVVMLQGEGTIVYLNPAAQWLLATQCGLMCGRNRLHAERSQDDQALQRAVHNSLTLGKGCAQAGGTVILRRPDGAVGLVIEVHALNVARERLTLGGPRIAAIAFLTRPQPPAAPTPEALASRYALTPAEVRLALALLKGDSLKDIAEAFCITPGTARSQLHAIFGKTGTRRQSAIIRLLLHAQS